MSTCPSTSTLFRDKFVATYLTISCTFELMYFLPISYENYDRTLQLHDRKEKTFSLIPMALTKVI